jgi:hypothetical protein
VLHFSFLAGVAIRAATDFIKPSRRSASRINIRPPSLLTSPPSKRPSTERRFELVNRIFFREFFRIA